MLKRSIAGMLASGALLALIATGHAQEMANADQLAVGLVPGGIIRPNPPFMVINPSTNKPFLPFQAPVPPPNDSPNPFNNPFPLSPNSQPSEGRVAPGGQPVRVTEIPGQWVYSWQYVPAPGNVSGSCEWQMVWMPGYTVTETTAGFMFSSRWVPRPTVPCSYGWVAAPPAFVPS